MTPLSQASFWGRSRFPPCRPLKDPNTLCPRAVATVGPPAWCLPPQLPTHQGTLSPHPPSFDSWLGLSSPSGGQGGKHIIPLAWQFDPRTPIILITTPVQGPLLTPTHCPHATQPLLQVPGRCPHSLLSPAHAHIPQNQILSP